VTWAGRSLLRRSEHGGARGLSPQLLCFRDIRAMTSTSTPSHTEEWLTGPRKTSFYTRLYSPPNPRAALVFAHGFIEHVGRYEHIFPQYAEKGISVLAFDMRGFGRTALDVKRSAGSSYGKTNAADQRADLRWALDEAAKKWPSLPLFLMGHSMVSRTAIRYLSTHIFINLCLGWRSCPLILYLGTTYQPQWSHRHFATHSPSETSIQASS
jgi:hypothetical protein